MPVIERIIRICPPKRHNQGAEIGHKSELILAISDVGQSVHMAEKKRFGGTITDSHPKS